MLPAIILDTETTDIENPEVLELAWQSCDIESPSVVVQGAHHRFHPSRPIAFGALATHHILLSELEGMPPAATAPNRVPPASYWIGHNIDFDWKALGQPPGIKRICTLAMCRAIWPQTDAHTQTAMMYFLFGQKPEVREKVLRAHGAAADIQLTAEILGAIVRLEGITSFDALWSFSEQCRIPRVFSFGKFKGQPIAAADRGYANWYARQADPDPYLIEAFRRARLL